MDNVATLLEASHKLKKAGYALWLDDFGSGYSSLNVLKDYKFDVLKIDMKFLSGFKENDKSKILINSIINMSDKLGMKTLTEGVETPEESEFLEAQKCGRLQGYLYGKPLPYEELQKAIKEGRYIISNKKD